MTLHIRLALMACLLASVSLMQAEPAAATSLSGTCSNWDEITMDDPVQREAVCMSLMGDGWRRFPSDNRCIVCHPDQWTEASQEPDEEPDDEERPLVWFGQGSLPSPEVVNGTEVAWAVDCRDGTYMWIRWDESAKEYYYQVKSTGETWSTVNYAQAHHDVCL
jgi:hypothetical protein